MKVIDLIKLIENDGWLLARQKDTLHSVLKQADIKE